MRRFRFASRIRLPHPPSAVFPFFADAGNLEQLTPGWLRFAIVTPTPVRMEVGTRLDYRLRVHGVPLRWRSLITEWNPPHAFTDEQERGPYRLWVHRHRFEEQDGGTLVTDEVAYAVFGGALVNRLFVRRDLSRIFAFRRERLRALFGTAGGPPEGGPSLSGRRRNGR